MGEHWLVESYLFEQAIRALATRSLAVHLAARALTYVPLEHRRRIAEAVGINLMSGGIAEVALSPTEVDQRERDELRDARDKLRGWQEQVAEGLGYLNRGDGQGGYEVADAKVIVAAWRTMERNCDELATLRSRIEALRFQGGLADPSTLAWALRVLDGKAVVHPPCHTCDGAGCQEPAPGSACTWRPIKEVTPRCICDDGGPGSYEGPLRDCPVHGEGR